MQSPIVWFYKARKETQILYHFLPFWDNGFGIKYPTEQVTYEIILLPMILLLRIYFSQKRTEIEAESQIEDCIFQSHWSKLIWSQLLCYVEVLDRIQIWAKHAYPTFPILLIAGKRFRVEIAWPHKFLNGIRGRTISSRTAKHLWKLRQWLGHV